MDIKAKIEELVNKIKSDKTLLENFKKNPIQVVEKLLGIDLPDDQLQAIVDGVKAKISIDDIGDALSGLGKLFKKKK